MKWLYLVILPFFISCQSSSPEVFQTAELKDLSSFMGTWYVQAGRFTPLERKVHNAIEVYTWNPKREIIEIDFRYNYGELDGPEVKLPQTGRIYDSSNLAHWKVSPFFMLQFDYLIVALDPEGSWSAIGVPDQSYLWIMTRERELDKPELDQIIAAVSNSGYPVNDLIYVPHGESKAK